MPLLVLIRVLPDVSADDSVYRTSSKVIDGSQADVAPCAASHVTFSSTASRKSMSSIKMLSFLLPPLLLTLLLPQLLPHSPSYCCCCRPCMLPWRRGCRSFRTPADPLVATSAVVTLTVFTRVTAPLSPSLSLPMKLMPVNVESVNELSSFFQFYFNFFF